MKKNSNVKNIVMAVLFGIVAFVVMLLVLHEFGGNNYKDMVWSSKFIAQGTTLTEDNVEDYFESIPTNEKVKNSNTGMKKSDLIGLTASRNIEESELINKKAFINEKDIRLKFNNPVLVSFSATDFSDAANGIIRKGDYINITKISKFTDSSSSSNLNNSNFSEKELLEKFAYVMDAFDSSGKKIEPGDNSSIATNFNIYVEQSDESAFYNEVSDKKIAVSKVDK